MTVTKVCKCGRIMLNVNPHKIVCDECIKERNRQKTRERYYKNKLNKHKEQKKENSDSKPKIKSLSTCMRESRILGITYGKFVQYGYDKIDIGSVLHEYSQKV